MSLSSLPSTDQSRAKLFNTEETFDICPSSTTFVIFGASWECGVPACLKMQSKQNWFRIVASLYSVALWMNSGVSLFKAFGRTSHCDSGNDWILSWWFFHCDIANAAYCRKDRHTSSKWLFSSLSCLRYVWYARDCEWRSLSDRFWVIFSNQILVYQWKRNVSR